MIQLMTGIRKTHKAAFFYEIAGPFKIDEVPTPEEVPPYGLLVKTRSVGICHSDLHLWQGDYKSIGLPKSLPWIVGHEIVGTIAKKGFTSSRVSERRHTSIGLCLATCG